MLRNLAAATINAAVTAGLLTLLLLVDAWLLCSIAIRVQ